MATSSEVQDENGDEEEENYIRMSLLLMGVSPRVVRVLFDREFSPICLEATLRNEYSKLLDLKLCKIISQMQWNILFPKTGHVESENFDVTLMVCLIRNLTSIADPPKGYERLPESHQTTEGADLARIKFYRNRLAHLNETKLDNATFDLYWKDITEAFGRLSDTKIQAECTTLRTKPLDKSHKEILLEVRHIRAEIELTKNDTVPWNVRELVEVELTQWQEDDKSFVSTVAATHVLQKIKSNSCVTVTGSFGVGKTAIVRHVALQMNTEGYDILPVADPGEIINFFHPRMKILFVIDDFCGKYSIFQTDIEKWKIKIKHIKTILENQNCKIILCCRLQVYKDLKLEVFTLFKSCECNLLSEQMCLLDSEKNQLAKICLKEKANRIGSYDKFDFFPLLCKLGSENSKLITPEFFESPYSVYESELNNIFSQNALYKYCGLALIVMFNNRLSEDCLRDVVDKEVRSIIKRTCDACNLNSGTPVFSLQMELDCMINTFLKKEDGIYSTMHDKLFDFLLFHFGNYITTCLIENVDIEIIEKKITLGQQNANSQFQLTLPEKYHQMYIERLVDAWSKGKVRNVFRNINFENLAFRETFFILYQ